MNRYLLVCEAVPLCIFVFLVYLVTSQAVDIPYWDQWRFADLFAKYYEGTLTWRDLLEPHNGHILVFAELVMLCLGVLTQWDTRYELWLNLSLGLSAYLWYRWLLQNRILPATPSARGSWMLPVAGVLVFSLCQWENWTWGWQSQIFMSTWFSLWAIGLMSVYKPSGLLIFCTAVLAMLGTFSFASGILVWPIGMILIWIRSQRIFYIAVWLVFAIPCVGFYLVTNSNSIWISPDHHREYLVFILVYIGAPLAAENGNVALYLGIAAVLTATGAITVLVFSRAAKVPAALFFIALLVWVFFSAVLTSIARAHAFPDQGLASRYTSFAVHFWMALSGLFFLCMNSTPSRLWQSVFGGGILLIVLASLYTSLQSEEHFFRRAEKLKVVEYIKSSGSLVNDDSAENNRIFSAVCWNGGTVINQLPILKKYHLSFYAQD